MMRSLSIRAKLTLWYLAVISTALFIFGLLSFGALRYGLLKVKRSTLNRREQRLLLFLEQNRQKHVPAPLSEQLESYALITHEGNLFQIRDLQGDLIFPLNPAGAAWLSHPATECAQPVLEQTTTPQLSFRRIVFERHLDWALVPLLHDLHCPVLLHDRSSLTSRSANRVDHRDSAGS
jgi:hypothetical protein